MSALGPENIPQPDNPWLESLMQYAPIGAAASITRSLLSNEKNSWGWHTRRTLAASITAWLCGPAIGSYIDNFNVMLLAIGAVSYAGPEVWDGVVRIVKRVFKAVSDMLVAWLSSRFGN